ncbi:hypothetical protein [Bacillus cereus]|nr:hypothetical protein [Bacillus cereus]
MTTNNIVKANGIGIATSKYPLSYFQRILEWWRDKGMICLGSEKQ